VEVMITAEDAAAGFRLPLPLTGFDGSRALGSSVNGSLRCGRPSGSAAGGDRFSTPGCVPLEHISRVALTARWTSAATDTAGATTSVCPCAPAWTASRSTRGRLQPCCRFLALTRRALERRQCTSDRRPLSTSGGSRVGSCRWRRRSAAFRERADSDSDCALRNFSVVATLIADAHRRQLNPASESIKTDDASVTECSIVDHGAKPGEWEALAAVNTQAIAQNVAACHAASPAWATVLIPAGRWRSGSINLTSNLELRLADGARQSRACRTSRGSRSATKASSAAGTAATLRSSGQAKAGAESTGTGRFGTTTRPRIPRRAMRTSRLGLSC